MIPLTPTSLRWKLISIVVAIQLLGFGALMLFQYDWAQRGVRSLHALRAAEAARLLNAALAPPVVSRDLEELRAILQQVHSEQGIPYLRLHDVDGNVLAEVGDPMGQSQMARNSGGLQHIPITLSGQIYGQIDLLFAHSVQQAQWAAFKKNAPLIGLGVLALSLTMLLLLTNRMLQRLTLLEETSRCMAAGDLQARAPEEGRDELATLGHRLNAMAHSLSQRHQQLQESETRFRNLAESSYDIVCEADMQGFFHYLSPASEQILGYDRQTLMSRPFLEFILPEDRQPTIDAMGALAQGERVVDFVNRYQHPDGDVRWISWRATPDLARQRTYNIARDITDLKRQQALLTQALQRAESANRAKSDFLAAMSHEIRTPMNIVIGMGDLLMESPLNAQQQVMARRLQRAGNTLLSLINDILDLSRIEAGRMEALPRRIAMRAFAEEVVDIFHQAAQEQGIALSLELAAELPEHWCQDPERITQVLFNLVGNAIKFTPAGGRITLSVSRAEGDDQLAFAVTDSGIGIAQGEQERIFQAFSQAESGSNRRFGGAGLGLTISRRIAESLGGTLSVVSAVGQGSCFTLTLSALLCDDALDYPGQDVSAQVAATAAEQALGARILLADDSADNRLLIQAFLRNTACEISEARNGEEAVELFQRERFDLVLMDIQMPQMDGLEATRRIRVWEAEQQRPPTPVLALSAHALTDQRMSSLEAGCQEHLIKPIRKATLLEALRKWGGLTAGASAQSE
ncbi:ATP-binding protein [Magnetofaba australis]|uniref:Sensory/regulatory protein RpfC n=1 Tax=Magnetofaba australis IT-1 TaxID=1434232 RepID=A0A1Y2JZ15_9PROT|nr:ATP-binding protein [Magnetofaba australis]OSM00147.1 putative multi-sensor hybrid histidine kinase [Magnetofaba australis IT-1]